MLRPVVSVVSVVIVPVVIFSDPCCYYYCLVSLSLTLSRVLSGVVVVIPVVIVSSVVLLLNRGAGTGRSGRNPDLRTRQE